MIEPVVAAARKVLDDWDQKVTSRMPSLIEELRRAIIEFDQTLEQEQDHEQQ